MMNLISDKTYKRAAAIGLAGILFMTAHAKVHAGNIRCRGNLVLEQQDEAGKVAFYEEDIQYLEREIEELKSQLGN